MGRAALLILLWMGCAPSGPPCGERVPSTVDAGPGAGGNVLIVVLDDVGVDQLGAWGVSKTTAPTPTIDCLCHRGVRFTQAWSAALCSPSRSELMTGRYDRRTSIGEILSGTNPDYELPESEDTLGEVAQRAGYTTALVGKWHLASEALPDAPTHPNRSGFDHFAGSLANLANSVEHHSGTYDYFRWEKVVDGEIGRSRTYATTDTVDEALDFVDRTDGPWLLVVSFNAPHEPVHAPPRRLLEHALPRHPTHDELYRAMLEAADHELARLFRDLDPQVLADTTVVLFGDNGTPRQDILPPFDPARSKGTMYEGGIRVPLVVTGPQVADPGSVSDALVHVVDVFATTADVLGVQPEAEVLDGRSLLPLLADPGGPPIHDTIASFLFGPVGSFDLRSSHEAIRDADHKLILDGSDPPQVFDVSAEQPSEGEDLLRTDHSADTLDAETELRQELDALESTFPSGP